MKRLSVLFITFIYMFTFTAACGAGGIFSSTISIGIISLDLPDSIYHTANAEDMERVFNSDNGYDVKSANHNTHREQVRAARRFIKEKVDYLLISAADANGWDDLLTEAFEAGVTVFFYDRMVNADPNLYEAVVVSDMENQGISAVSWLKQQYRDGGQRILHLNEQMGSAAQIGRADPLLEEVYVNDYWAIARESTPRSSLSADEAKEFVGKAILDRVDFNTVYAHNDEMARGAMEALQDAGITHGIYGDVWIVGFGFNKFALRYIQSGDWNYDGQYSPFHADILDGFIQALEKREVPDIPGDKIVIIDEIYADILSVNDSFIENYGIGD